MTKDELTSIALALQKHEHRDTCVRCKKVTTTECRTQLCSDNDSYSLCNDCFKEEK